MDTYNDNNTNSNNPANREQLPVEPTLVEQLQFEVDELNGKLREEKALKLHFKNKVILSRMVVDKMEQLEQQSGFRITGATLNDGKEYLRIKEELFNLIRG